MMFIYRPSLWFIKSSKPDIWKWHLTASWVWLNRIGRYFSRRMCKYWNTHTLIASLNPGHGTRFLLSLHFAASQISEKKLCHFVSDFRKGRCPQEMRLFSIELNHAIVPKNKHIWVTFCLHTPSEQDWITGVQLEVSLIKRWMWTLSVCCFNSSSWTQRFTYCSG